MKRKSREGKPRKNKDGKPRKKNMYRAGKRKCTRCKEVWHRKKGDKHKLCKTCRTHCGRCYTLLTKETISVWETGRGRYLCKACALECDKLTKGNAGGDRRDNHLVRTYGITAVEYDAILKTQNGGCWICGKVPSEGQKRLSVDHLHSKGEKKRNPREKRGRVRGLLCWHCNVAIGKFGDDITKLRKAAEYLEVWPAQSVLKEKSNG